MIWSSCSNKQSFLTVWINVPWSTRRFDAVFDMPEKNWHPSQMEKVSVNDVKSLQYNQQTSNELIPEGFWIVICINQSHTPLQASEEDKELTTYPLIVTTNTISSNTKKKFKSTILFGGGDTNFSYNGVEWQKHVDRLRLPSNFKETWFSFLRLLNRQNSNIYFMCPLNIKDGLNFEQQQSQRLLSRGCLKYNEKGHCHSRGHRIVVPFCFHTKAFHQCYHE